jgi:hypothetical protein
MAIGNLVVNPNNNTGLYNLGGVPVPTNVDLNIPGNLTVGGTILSNGNITTNAYFIGNGAFLTGIASGYGNANVAAFLPTYTGSLGTANSTPIGAIYSDNYFYANGVPFVSSNYGNSNVAAYLPVNNANVQGANFTTIGPPNTGNIVGVQYVSSQFYLGDGGLLSNIAGSYSNANVQSYLASNANVVITTTGAITSTANISGNYILGNGSQLTGLPEQYGNANVAAYLPTYTGNLQAGNIATIGPQGNITGANLVVADAFIGSGANLNLTTLNGHVIPAANAAFTLGNITNRWNNVWVSGTAPAGIFVGDGSGLTNVGNYGNANVISLLANYGNNIIVSNSTISATNFVGNGAQLTNLPIQPGTYTNANVEAYLPTSNTITAIQGNVTTLQGQVYGNANVAAYLPTYTGNLSADVITGNLFVGNGAGLTNLTGANVTGTVPFANIVTNPAQTNITSLGNLTTVNTGTLLVTGQLTSNSNAQFNGDVYFAGNVTLPGNINQISGNSGSFFGNAVTGFGALYAGLPAGYTLLNQEITQFAASFAGYTQVSIRNIDSGTQATGDLVVTADNGTDTKNFVDLGIAGSGYDGAFANNSLGTVLFRTDSYLYSQGNAGVGGNLILGSNELNGVVRIIANGQSNLANVVATFSSTGVDLPGTVTANAFVGSGAQLTNVPPSSNIGSVASAATITPSATNTQYNVTALATGATIAAPTGSPVDGAKLVIRIVDNGTAQSIAWNAIYRAVGIVLPIITVAGKAVYAGCIYNSQAVKWDVVSIAQEA